MGVTLSPQTHTLIPIGSLFAIERISIEMVRKEKLFVLHCVLSQYPDKAPFPGAPVGLEGPFGLQRRAGLPRFAVGK
jgi:hypothetical protein